MVESFLSKLLSISKKSFDILIEYSDLSPVKKGNCFLSLTTAEITFLEFKNYLAPNYCLAHFLKHYDVTEVKGSCLYETVQCIDDLKQVGLPVEDDFFPSLKIKQSLIMTTQ